MVASPAQLRVEGALTDQACRVRLAAHGIRAGGRSTEATFLDPLAGGLVHSSFTRQAKSRTIHTMERSLVLIKPDAFQRGLVGRIVSRFEDKGLQLIGAKMLVLSDAMLDQHYSHLKDLPFFGDVKEFMKCGPVLALCWEGLDAVATIRTLCGITKAREASPGTIRGDLGMSIQCNLVHASESLEAAGKELRMFFEDEELFPFALVVAPFVYSRREQGTGVQ